MAAKAKKEVSMEEALWKSADKLRGSVEPSEYKHVVLSLFFLKFASDKFKEQKEKKSLLIILPSTQKIMFSTFQKKVDGHLLWIMQSRMTLH